MTRLPIGASSSPVTLCASMSTEFGAVPTANLKALLDYLRESCPDAELFPIEVPAPLWERHGLAVDRPGAPRVVVLGTRALWHDSEPGEIARGVRLLELNEKLRGRTLIVLHRGLTGDPIILKAE